MGSEPIIQIVWLVAGVAGLLLAWRAIGRKQWLTAAGTVTGWGIGFVPLLIWPGQPMAFMFTVVLGVAASNSLVVSYVVRRRIGRTITATLLVLLPLTYTLVMQASAARSVTGSVDHVLKLLGAFVILAGPLTCVLACREVAKIFDPRARLEYR